MLIYFRVKIFDNCIEILRSNFYILLSILQIINIDTFGKEGHFRVTQFASESEFAEGWSRSVKGFESDLQRSELGQQKGLNAIRKRVDSQRKIPLGSSRFGCVSQNFHVNADCDGCVQNRTF